jgi:hypothetical protein
MTRTRRVYLLPIAAALLLIGLSAAAAFSNPLHDRFSACRFNLPEALYAGYFTVAGDTADYVQFEGDSLTKGQGSTFGIDLPVLLLPRLIRPIYFRNRGICGLQLAEMKAAAESARPEEFRRPASHRILVEDGGSNDIATGIDGTRLFHEIFLPYVAARRAAGFDSIIAATLIYRDDLTAAKDAQRGIFNKLLRDSAPTYGYQVVDYDRIRQLQKPQSTGFLYDDRHPTTRGYGLMADQLATVLNAILSAQAQIYNP